MQKTLTRNDRKKIQQKIWQTGGFILFAIAIFAAIYFFVLGDSFQKVDRFSPIFTVILSLFAVFFVGIVVYMITVFVKDLKAGVENCFEGTVEDKRLNIKKTTKHRAGNRRGSKSSTQRYYYMTINGKEHKIAYKMYADIKVGDTVYFEIAPNSKIVLSYKILESEAAKTLQTSPLLHKQKYPTYKTRQAPLTQKDKETIHTLYYQKLRKHLTYIAIVGLPIFGLIYNHLYIFVLFLFPLSIILLYQLYKAIRLYVNYKRSINSGRKNLTSTHIVDKLFTTINRNGRNSENYKIKTTYKTFIVPESIYTKLHTGGEVVVHEATHLATAIGVTVDDRYLAF